MFRKIVAFLLSGLILIISVLPVAAEEADHSKAPEVKAKAAILVEATTGETLFAMNEHEQLAPASVTKIMTMILVLEQMQAGKLKQDDIVTASANARAMGGSEINLDTGEQMTVHDLMMATAVASANDAAVALGEHIAGGSEAKFVEMMNARAKELGMNDTHFVNPCGLPEEGHVTSAYDIAIMSRHLITLDHAIEYLTTNLYPIREGENEYKMRNSNELVRTYEGCIGIKTGYTDEAGYCLSAGATRNGKTMISVVLGAEQSHQRNVDSAALLDYGFENFDVYNVVLEPVKPAPIPVKLGLEDTVEVDVPELKVAPQIIKAGWTPEVEQKVVLEKQLNAPVKKGQKVGTVTVSMDGKTLLEQDLVAKENIGKRSFWKAFTIILKEIITM